MPFECHKCGTDKIIVEGSTAQFDLQTFDYIVDSGLCAMCYFERVDETDPDWYRDAEEHWANSR